MSKAQQAAEERYPATGLYAKGEFERQSLIAGFIEGRALPENPDPAVIEAMAEAAAIHDDYDGCFLRVAKWEAQEQWEREAHPDEYPANDYEDCEWWRARARAAYAALRGAMQ